MADVTPETIASKWISAFKTAVEASDPAGVAGTFLAHGWLRDVLTFTWDTRSIRGPTAIASYLSASDPLVNAKVTRIRLSDDPNLRPSFSHGPPGAQSGIEAGFDYETPYALGRGYFRLSEDEDRVWKARSVCTMLWNLKGYEEPLGPRIDREVEDHAWIETERKRQENIENDPYVLISMYTIITC